MRGQVKSILCVHPNGELYGSDRVFLQVIEAFRSRWPHAVVTVVLPIKGQLSAAVHRFVDDVRIEQMVVLRRARPLATLTSMLRLPWAIARARTRMRSYDLVYISTVIPLNYLLATPFTRNPLLIHVHELPTGKTQLIVSGILRYSRGFLIFISNAVSAAFPHLSDRASAIVWNGVRSIATGDRVPSGALHVLLIGRFNAWKGQCGLIEAVARIPAEQRRGLEVQLVGSAFAGQEHFVHEAEELIITLGVSDCITISGFEPNPDSFYAWADVVVVPSTQPEPFGLVAIEAMSASCATIAADHGGLSEIVVDGTTGRLFQPGNVDRLAQALLNYLDDRAMVRLHGEAGRLRFEQYFQEKRFMTCIADVATEQVAQKSLVPKLSQRTKAEKLS